MRRKSKILVLLISLVMALCCVLAGCNKEKNTIKPAKFKGEYEMSYVCLIKVYGYIPEGREHVFRISHAVNLTLTENGYNYISSFNSERQTNEEISLDKNLVDTINGDLASIGNNAVVKRRKIIFEDTGEARRFEGYYFTPTFESGILFYDIEGKEDSRQRLSMYAEYDDEGRRNIHINIADYVTTVDGVEYEYAVHVVMLEK